MHWSGGDRHWRKETSRRTPEMCYTRYSNMGGKVLVLGLLMVGGGIVSIALGYSVQRRDQVLKSWPSAPGTIVSSSIIRTTQARLRVPATRGGASPDPTYRRDLVWALAVQYQYSVGGKVYIGYDATSSLLVENIHSTGNPPSPRMQSLATQLVAGSHTAVHYNPDAPEQSYLAYIDAPGKARSFRIGGFCVVAGLLVAAAGRVL